MKAKCFFRKLNFLIAFGGILAALFFYGCDNLLASASSPDTPPVNFVPVAAREGYGIVNGTLPSSDSASARTAMPGAAVTVVSYKVFAQNGSDRIEANVNNSTSTFSISLPYGTWNITARGLDAGGNIVATQTKQVTLSEAASSVNTNFELGYSTNSADGYGKTSLSVSFPAAQIHGVEYTLSKGETKISVNVSELTGSFKIERTFEDLGAWHLTIKFYGDFSNLVYRIDQTVNVYANLTTDTFEGSAPYISGGAIALTEALLADFQNTTLYVDAGRGKDTNTGTQFDPLETFNRAVELVNNSTRDDSTEFRILLQSSVTDGAQLELKAGKKLTVANADGVSYTIESLGRTFTVNTTSELTLQSVKFKKLRFEVSGSLEMNGGEISGNTADNGGAIYVEAGGKAKISGTKIFGNTATEYGGGVCVNGSGTFEMNGGEISGNTTDAYGGGISCLNGTLTITGGTISGNNANISAGGVYVYNSTFTMDVGEVSENTAASNGGGVYVNTGSTFTMKGGTIISNVAKSGGGGIYIRGAFSMEGGTISENEATDFQGGGICITEIGTCEIKNGTVFKNKAQNAGGVLVDGIFKMEGGTISENIANTRGGGVWVRKSAAFTMNGGTIDRNTTNYGGGVCVGENGTFTMSGGTIGGNTESDKNTAKNGGGVYVEGDMSSFGTFTMKGGIISGNTASTNGGAVYVNTNGTFSMEGTTSTISENKASVDGGAVYVNSNATFTMDGGTISKNIAYDGGGIFLYRSTASMLGGTFTMNGGEISYNKATYGGGIWTNIYSEFEMNGGTISENIANTNGGGVYAAGGTFEMSGGTISENTANTNGGGVYVAGGTFEMSDTATISGNYADTDGGGVYIAANSSFTMSKGTISKNKSKYGGGVYIATNGKFIMDDGKIIDNLTGNGVWSKGTFEMNGGIISGHSVIGKGGGVYVNDGSFTMNGGTIRGNAAADKGNGAYINSTFNMSGNAKFEDNDIYLDNANTIHITNALTATTPVATITPSSYEEEWQVLSKGSGITAITSDICKQFALTTLPDDDTKWKISPNADGTQGILKVNSDTIYVRGSNATWYTSNEPTAANGSDSNSGTLLSPFATIQKAVETVLEDNDGSSPYTIYVDGIVTPGAAAGANGMADFSALTQDLTLTIKALSESAKATLDANGTSRVMNAKPTGGTLKLTLENLVIKGGNVSSNSGGGIEFVSAGGVLTMTGCEVRGNEANYGGGIYTTGALEMESCTVSGNTASASGGGIYIDGCTVTMKDCTIDGNIANSQGGGGIYIAGSTASLEMESCIVSGNTSDTTGAGVHMSGGTFEISGTAKISGNEATGSGGGVFVGGGEFTMGGGTVSENKASNGGGVFVYPGAKFTMTGGTISKNEATSNGGGVYVNGNTSLFTMSGGEISGNKASQSGGGIYDAGTCTMSVGTISGNTAKYGGGVFVYPGANFTMTDGTISKNEATSNGGGVYVNGGTLIMEGGTVTDNTSDGDGGGVYITSSASTFTMEDGEISGNEANYGGGVYIASNSTFTMKKGTITDNTARGKLNDGKLDGGGGGVYINGSTFTMEGGEISGNETAGANANSGGGGIYLFDSATFTMTGGTVSGNTAANGQGKGAFISPNCTFNMSGAAQFADTDDVYLYVYTGATLPTITVAGNLSKTKVATITLPDSAYVAGTQVLSADGTNVTALNSTICGKFSVTPDSDGTEWSILPKNGDNTAGVLARMTFYVRGTGAGWYTENPGFSAAAGNDTTGNGTKTKPFATIQKAINEVIAQNGGSNECTIYVDGTLTQSAAPSGGRGMADFYASNKTLKVKIEALSTTTKATLDANKKSRVIYAKPTSGWLTLTMKNLIVTNGDVGTTSSPGLGGGIYWDGDELTIDGCTISGNQVRGSSSWPGKGGGIYSDGIITMKDCTISGNIAMEGGGIYNYDKFAMNSGTISGNEATKGGGVYIYGIGAVSFTMNAGTISGNTASGNGGGVYDEGGRFTQNGGTVTGNTPDDVYTAP